MLSDVQANSDSGIHTSASRQLDFQRLFEAAPAPMMVLDDTLRIIGVTDSYNRATQTVRAAMVGRRLFDIFPDNPDDPAADGVRNLRRSLDRVLRDHVTDTMALQKYDIPVIGDHGTHFEERWWSCANVPVLDPDGALLWIIHRAEDVTEFARTRSSMRDGRITARSFSQGQGAMEADLLQRADDANRDLRNVNDVLERRVAERTHELAEKNAALEAENAERKRIEGALRASEAHLRDVELRAIQEQLDRERNVFDRFFTLSQDVMCFADREGSVQRVNPAIQRFGYSDRELLGRPLWDLMHPEDVEDVRTMLSTLADGRATVQIEARLHCKDGSYRWLSWTTTPDATGALYAVARDVTEARANSDELRRAKAQADSANRELESFCYTVAHDLRAPLRSIDGFSQALLEDYGDKLDEEGKGYLGRLRGGAQRMAHLIDDLLALSRLSRGELNRERVDLSALAEAVGGRLRDSYPDRKVALQIEPKLRAVGDNNLISNVLENLIGNAWKFTRDRAEARIEVGSKKLEGERVFYVRDNGAGFDMAYAHKLFGAFQRLHAVREFEGTGIGLASVQRIINRHGGRIWPEAEVDKGATFYFTLPGEELT